MEEPEFNKQEGAWGYLSYHKTPLVLSIGTFITVVGFSIVSSFKIATHLNNMSRSVEIKSTELLLELRSVVRQQAVLAEQQREFNKKLVDLSHSFVQHEKLVGHEGMMELQQRTFKQVERLIDSYEKIGLHSHHYDNQAHKYHPEAK